MAATIPANVIRTTLTFMFDAATVSVQDIKDRLDAALEAAFGDDVDVHTRWVSTLSQAALFGAAMTGRALE